MVVTIENEAEPLKNPSEAIEIGLSAPEPNGQFLLVDGEPAANETPEGQAHTPGPKTPAGESMTTSTYEDYTIYYYSIDSQVNALLMPFGRTFCKIHCRRFVWVLSMTKNDLKRLRDLH